MNVKEVIEELKKNEHFLPPAWKVKLMDKSKPEWVRIFAVVYADTEDQAREIIHTLLKPGVVIDDIRETMEYPLILVGGIDSKEGYEEINVDR